MVDELKTLAAASLEEFQRPYLLASYIIVIESCPKIIRYLFGMIMSDNRYDEE
jgi:hypothetical protein